MSYIGNTNTTQAFTPAVDYFSGNGSTTAFTLSRPVASVAQVEAVIDNVVQNPSSAYTVSNNTITFTSAPLSGTNNIYVRYTSPITQVIAPGQGTVTATSMASSTGTGAGVFQTSPTITTPTIDTITSAASTALTLKSAGTTAVTIDTSQNVGIGTASPTTRVHASIASATAYTTSSRANVLTVQNTTASGYAGIEFLSEPPSGNAGIAGINSFAPSSGDSVLAFSTRGGSTLAERMRIDSSGYVTINNLTSLNSVFSVYGKSNIAPCALQVNANGDYGYVFKNASGTLVGAIGVNASTTSYNTSSDYRLKENIAPMTGALAKVAQLKPVTYKWKVDGADGEGFIAHELAEVKPDCVSGTKDEVDASGNPKYQGIDTSFLVATLTAAIQELKAINDQQAETINALTARIEALENR